MQINSYDIGDVVKLIATFKNETGNEANPSTVTVKIKEPDGSVTIYTDTSPEMSNPSTGVFRVDFEASQSGSHIYRWEGTGAVTSAEEHEFYVRETEI